MLRIRPIRGVLAIGVVHTAFFWWMGGVVEDANGGNCREGGMPYVLPMRLVMTIGGVHTTLLVGDLGSA